jgi:hypothetical protein
MFCVRKVKTRTQHLPRLGVALPLQCIDTLIAYNLYVGVISKARVSEVGLIQPHLDASLYSPAETGPVRG